MNNELLALILEILFLIALVRSLPKDWRSTARTTLFLVSLWLIFWLALVQIELLEISPDGTYGSDARTYYHAMLSTLDAGRWCPPSNVHNPGYVAFGVLVLRLSPTNSVIWVKLANVGLFLLSLVLILHLLHFWNISKRVAFFVTSLSGMNGIVVWMVLRNLKDTLVLCSSLAILVGTKALLSEKQKIPLLLKLLGIALIGLIGGKLFFYLRPWGLYWATGIVVAGFIEALYRKELLSSKRSRILFVILALILATIFVGVFYKKVGYDLQVFRWYAQASGGLSTINITEFLLALARFLIGPGPVRAIFGWKAFVVTTTTGNILIALGSFMWWFFLPFLILAFFRGPSYWLKYSSTLIPLVLFIGVYTLAYSGSLETRFRAIVYTLAFPSVAPYLESFLRLRNSKAYLLYFAVALGLLGGGLITSYTSLVNRL